MYATKEVDSYFQTDIAFNTTALTEQISYNIFIGYVKDEIDEILSNDEHKGLVSLSTGTLRKFVDNLKTTHNTQIYGRSPAVQDLFILHQIAKVLKKYNDNCLKLSQIEFRSKIYYPNIVYLLLRILNPAHKFLQTNIKTIYSSFYRKNTGLLKVYTNSFYMDEDVIKTDVLYEFLGNALLKFNPLTIDNFNGFYRQVIRSIFSFYFKKEHRIHTSYGSYWSLETNLDEINNSTIRINIYRDVLYELQADKIRQCSPILNQLYYNFNIFKNVIISNELQNMYFNTHKDDVVIGGNEYKILKLYKDVETEHNYEFIEEIKKLPLIYKLLKCAHIINPKSKPYNEMLIKPEQVQIVVLDELVYPFKNMFNDTYMYGILDRISKNFTNTILTGEYINLITLETVKINHISFLNQIRNFVRLCLQTVKNEYRI